MCSAGLCEDCSVVGFLQFNLCFEHLKVDRLSCGFMPPPHTQPFNGPLSGTAWWSRYQKGKTNLDFTEA